MPAVKKQIEKAEECLDEGDFDQAYQIAQKIIQHNPSELNAYFIMAESCYELESFQEAFEIYQKALALFPDNQELLAAIAELNINFFEEFEKGLQLCDQVIKKTTLEKNPELFLDVMFLKSVALLSLGKSQESVAILGQLEKTPEMFEILPESFFFLHYGLSLFETFRFEESIAKFQHALLDDEELAVAHHFKAIAYEWLDEKEKSKESYQQAHEIDPEHFPVPLDISITEFKKIYQKALLSLDQRIIDLLKDVPIHFELMPLVADLIKEEPPFSPLIGAKCSGEPPASDIPIEKKWLKRPKGLFLYVKNMLRLCESEDEVEAEIHMNIEDSITTFLSLPKNYFHLDG